jgi:hypothetical protein
MAYQASRCGKPRDALELAGLAVKQPHGAHPAVQAINASRFAFAHALVGAEYEAREAIGNAERLLDKSFSFNDVPEWLYWFDGAALEAQVGHTLMMLASKNFKKAKNSRRSSD